MGRQQWQTPDELACELGFLSSTIEVQAVLGWVLFACKLEWEHLSNDPLLEEE